MHQVLSPRKNKLYPYETAERAEEVARQVEKEQDCKLVLDDNGDWVLKAKKKD